MKETMYLELTHKNKKLKGKENFNYHLYGEFPFNPGVTPETALIFLGLADTYTAKEITEEEYIQHKKASEKDVRQNSES